MDKKFYITTAIAYASAKPHIGNTYEIVLTDAIARYKRLTGYDVFFQTGTDEHGQKIQNNAIAKGMNNQKYVDDVSLEIRRIWDIMNTSYDKFVRTTNLNHKNQVSKIFEKLYNQGDIYLSKYEGLYCTPCESFFSETQLKNGKCPDCERDVTKTSEEAYFFKLSKYADWLDNYIKENPDFIQPDSRRNEIVNNFIKPGLQDLCVSRTSFDWGVPVTFDDDHIIYVWIDALSNYITFLGYDVDGNHDENFKKYWPANVHIIGKDILRFHAIYWPILLKALNLELPHKIFGHPWLMLGQEKMSKSRGNILYADDLIKVFGVDGVRYYLLNEMSYANDGVITYDLLVEKINAELANNLGNLVNRTISMVHKYFDGIVMEPTEPADIDQDLKDVVLKSKFKIEESMNQLRVSDATKELFSIFDRSNKYIDETTPWVLAKDKNKTNRLATVLYNLLEAIRHGAVLLQAFLPETAEKIFEQLNTLNNTYESLDNYDGFDYGIKLNQPVPLFIRLDKDKVIKGLDN